MKIINNKTTGAAGETLAAEYMKNLGYEIVGKNVQISHKEIDLVAEDDRNVVFVEVKTRNQANEPDDKFGRPASRIDAAKKGYLVAAAKAYVKMHSCDKLPRIDVIEVYLKEEDPGKRIVYIRNAINAR